MPDKYKVKYRRLMGGEPSDTDTVDTEFIQIKQEFLTSDTIHAKEMIEQNPNIVFAKDKSERTLLHYVGSRKDLAELLVENGATVDEPDNEGTRPICLVQGEAISVLIQKGADPNQRNNNGFSPLSCALGREDLDAAGVMIKNGADINEQDSEGTTFLGDSVKKGNFDVVKFLVDNKADGTKADNQGRTPLHVAIQEGNRDIIKLLVESYPDTLDSKDDEEKTPFQDAINQGGDLPKILLGLKLSGVVSVGVPYFDENYNEQQKGGGVDTDTLLHLAVKENDPTKVEAILVKRTAELDKPDPDPTYNFDIDAGGEYEELGLSPLQLVYFLTKNEPHYDTDKSRDIFKILVKNGAKPDFAGEQKITLLHLAAFFGDNTMVEDLIKKGLDVNALDSHNTTPLFFAAKNGHTETVRILLAIGANRTIKNKEEKTPFEVATDPEIKKMLFIPSCGVCNASP
jgi:cytohesin